MHNDVSPLAGYLYARGVIPEEPFDFDAAMTLATKTDACLTDFVSRMDAVTDDWTEDQIMAEVYEAGKVAFKDDLRFWFRVLYQIMMKEESGPRFGQFIRIFGVDRTLDTIYHVRTFGYWKE